MASVTRSTPALFGKRQTRKRWVLAVAFFLGLGVLFLLAASLRSVEAQASGPTIALSSLVIASSRRCSSPSFCSPPSS